MPDLRTIRKFRVTIHGVAYVNMPANARVLPYIEPGAVWGSLTLWAEVDPTAPMVKRRFRIVGTGQPIPDTYPCHYLGTTRCGNLIWHVYDASDPTTGVVG